MTATPRSSARCGRDRATSRSSAARVDAPRRRPGRVRRLHQPHGFAPHERQLPARSAPREARSTACSAVGAIRWAAALWQSMQSIIRDASPARHRVGRFLRDVLFDAALPRRSPSRRGSSARRVGASPCTRPSATDPRASESRVPTSAPSPRASATPCASRCSPRRRCTRECPGSRSPTLRRACDNGRRSSPARRPQVGARRNRARIELVTTWTSCRTPASLACTKPAAFADVARDAGHTRVRARLPGGDLRVHRRVAGLSAELRRFHPVQPAVAGDQDNRDVGRGQRGDERAVRRTYLTEIEDRPVAAALGSRRSRRRWSHMPNGNQQQAEDEGSREAR